MSIKPLLMVATKQNKIYEKTITLNVDYKEMKF